MSKYLFANEQVMKNYLGALLKEDPPEQKVAAKPLEKLLEKVQAQAPVTAEKPATTPATTKALLPKPAAAPAVKEVASPKVEKEAKPVKSAQKVKEISSAADTIPVPPPPSETSTTNARFSGEFQALFFDVAGLTLALPLEHLGGIHQCGEVSQIFGKPAWFSGVMLNRDEKINVVDTARWVMPEKYDNAMEQALNYKYVIMLGKSKWGLLAENLINNVTLHSDDVKWRAAKGKRPWLAGMIKEKMCALIDVDNLHQLLEQGLDSQEQ